MKTRIISIFTLVVLAFGARADEGMWLPFMIGRNYEDMKKHGLNLSAEDIYSINNSSIKDAIISFGGFCTGEIISDKGLILTNHHCGYDAIADVSTEVNNYLDNGFWAKDIKQEIPIKGLTATFIIRIEDVSDLINKELNENMSEEERLNKIREISKILEDDAINGTHYKAFVRDFFEGNEFYLFVQEQFLDIRLVGTPPQSSGKFGGDTDNWMWPRHTADFSMFRVYSGPDNKPAAYSADNKPFTPRHSLPISLKGVQENDFAMVMGFPGSTDRYLSSYGVRQAITLEQPKRVDVRAKKLEIMKSYMDQDVSVRLKYSSKYAQVANYWKYFIGQTEQVKNNDVIGKKEKLEQEYRDYMANKRVAFPVLEAMDDYYKKTDPIINIKVYQSEFIFTVDMNVTTYRYKFWIDALDKGETERAGMTAMRLGMMGSEFFTNANMDIELDILNEVLKMYIQDVPEAQMGAFTKKIAAKGAKGVDKFVAKVRKKSIFANKAKFEAFNASPDRKVLEKDPLFQLIMDMDKAHAAATGTDDLKKASDALDKANRFFVSAIRQMQPDKLFYPNANSTMRLTYGNVLPYNPKDGVTYHYTTTIDGIMEKEDPTNPEFVVDPRMKELWMKKDYGQYADANGNLTVNFLSNNDITGGNSGSPVINGDGHLIGTAFDGNWEAMSGDIYFEPNIQRTISVDIRYTLWIVDKCYGATNLIEEMKIIK